MAQEHGIDARRDATAAWERTGPIRAPSGERPPARPVESGGSGGDSEFETPLGEGANEGISPLAGWSRKRQCLLLAFALAGAAGFALWIHLLIGSPQLDASWRATPAGGIELVHSDDPALHRHENAELLGVTGNGSAFVPLNAQVLRRSARWVIADADRAQQGSMQAALADALGKGAVSLSFADGGSARVLPAAPLLANLPLLFWIMSTFGLALYFVPGLVLIANPVPHNRVYAVAAWCQAANMLMIATESTRELGLAEPFASVDMPLRMALDLVTGVAIVAASCLHPQRLRGTTALAVLLSCAAAFVWVACLYNLLPDAWWWTQGGVAVFCLAIIGLLSRSYSVEPHPFALVLRRFAVLTLTTWLLLTAALVAAGRRPGLYNDAADIGAMVWYVFLGSLLLLVPFFAQTRNALRELPLLSAVCSVALSLDLLLVSLAPLSPFAALTLAVFISLALYSGARRWVMDQLMGSSKLTSERMLEQLYRITRELEAEPLRAPILFARLVGNLFEPLEVSVVEHHFSRTRVASDGSRMLVPMPLLSNETAPRGSVMMRFAQRGRRLFSAEDARLSDRIVEQLRRAVNFDRAVEQGRSEERLRLAQDLHDDIGARLLTLMYKAASSEMEEYARHTLQDLKTLTRGLAASNHRLSHASAEWKSDLAHRLTAAQVELNWSCIFDEDVMLTVVHWSALTRVLRELVSNAIAHAKAQRLEIDFRLEKDRVDLTVTDDGIGTAPNGWSHGLGLGGVRKRVKQLGGSVEWREAEPRGISCRVVIRELSTRA